MKMTTSSKRLLSWAVAVLLYAGYAAAQAGTLDPTFATGGIFTSTEVRSNAGGVAIQSDGKIVVAGGDVADNNFGAILFRLTTSGALDTTFGTGGVATVLNTNAFFALALESDGKIVAAGSIGSGNSNAVVVARFEANGQLDTSFGKDGVTTTTLIPIPFNCPGSLALLANGEILAAGGSPGVMGRFTVSGQLDSTFGSGGVVNLTGPASSCPTRIAVQPSGEILVASGYSEINPTASGGAISRYNSNGSLDSTFGSAGTAASVTSAQAMTLLSDGKIVVAGAIGSSIGVPPAVNDTGFGIARYSSNGVVDATFGTGGVTIVDFGAAAPLAGPYAVAIQSTGDIVAGGAAAQGQEQASFNSAFGLTRVTSAGVLDTTFGSDGIVMTTIESGSEVFSQVFGLAIQSDGKIVAAGSTSVDLGFTESNANVARYLSQ
jgi:uncharacterized delta-60 repeat protein